MLPLSEKAKGKQRALNPESEPTAGPSAPPTVPPSPEPSAHRDVLVRFSEGAHDLLIPVTRTDTIKDIKRQIRVQRPPLERRRLKLIHSGRLLHDATHLLEYIQNLEKYAPKPEEDSSILFSAKETDKGKGKAKPEPPKPVWLHCSVGTRLEPHEEDDGGLQQQTAQVRPLRGFDRLAAAGFSESEISALRAQFHSTPQGLDDVGSGGGTVLNEEELEDQARILEERWIDSLDNGREHTSAAAESTAVATLVQGLLVGFFFPLLPFFFMREARQPAFWSDGRGVHRMGSVVFSRRMQIAIVMGFVMNVSFGTWRYLSS
ncbi:hypothetical protein EXIGLDRAFT_644247 [Exidia glandulosa HHB12029]|uniref:Ubiquitin-like domain-containing protein n=1 Tax=Exidia glandulosa HHB12029 TaxID=1314781 RepID=A0A165JXI3_EXIGL|nr:hypothetical protein EXIGLDRAFT_644247 [Exidia glandulosa HHB12029]